MENNSNQVEDYKACINYHNTQIGLGIVILMTAYTVAMYLLVVEVEAQVLAKFFIATCLTGMTIGAAFLANALREAMLSTIYMNEVFGYNSVPSEEAQAAFAEVFTQANKETLEANRKLIRSNEELRDINSRLNAENAKLRSYLTPAKTK